MTRLHSFSTTVVVIGGGLSGAAVAYTLAVEGPSHLRIVVIEPGQDLGRGVAYGATRPEHRLNVPHIKMSLRTSEPEQFATWLDSAAAPPLPEGARTAVGHIFAPRAVFGTYVAQMLAPHLASGKITHRRDRAASVTPDPRGHVVVLDSGDRLVADAVVLAVAHPEPAVPQALQGLIGTPFLVKAPFADTSYAALSGDEGVLIVGSGLTSADILATLEDRGHRGPITVISRHGWRSQPHGPAQTETTADFTQPLAQTALGLLRNVRKALAQDAALGLTWHAVFDRLRAQGPLIWAALPEAERKRFLRHLRSLWDVHRFRIAPQSYATLERLEAAGKARFLKGHLIQAQITAEGPAITWRARGQTAQNRLTVGRVFLATGPDHARVTRTNALLRALVTDGVIAPDPLGLGVLTAPSGRTVRADGTENTEIFITGPLARGTVGELMGVPEVTGWAETIARAVLDALQTRPQAATPMAAPAKPEGTTF